MVQNIFLQEYFFQSSLVFLSTKKYIKYFRSTTRINFWKSNALSEESVENITKSDSNFAPTSVNHHLLPDIYFNGLCLINNNISIPKKVISLYVSYILNPLLRKLKTDFTLNNCLLGSKNVHLYKYKYSGYGLGFVPHLEF